MLSFPSVPSARQPYQQWQWDGTKWLHQANSNPQCGLFQLYGSSPSTQVQFRPYKGNLIKINGTVLKIPTAGVIGVVSSASLDGVTGKTLADGFYFVYLMVNSTFNLAIDFSATGPAVSATPGNVGVMIKTGDDTRSLIGIVYVMNTKFYYDTTYLFVRSWFNRLYNPLVISTGGGGWGVGAQNIASCMGVAFAGETMIMKTVWNSASGVAQHVSIWNQYNGTNQGPAGTFYQDGAYRMSELINQIVMTTAGLGQWTSVIQAQAQGLANSAVYMQGEIY